MRCGGSEGDVLDGPAGMSISFSVLGWCVLRLGLVVGVELLL